MVTELPREDRYDDAQRSWIETKVKLEPAAARELWDFTQPPYRVPLWKIVSDGLRLYLRIRRAGPGDVIDVPGTGRGQPLQVWVIYKSD